MLTAVAVNTHIEQIQANKLHYDHGYVRCIRHRETLDQWMFHVTEIRSLQVQRNEAGHLRIKIYMMGGCESFNTPRLEATEIDGCVLVAMALLALRDYELGLDEQTYSERTFDVERDDF